MATITFVIPPIDENRFSGGTLCLLEHASGLRARGHQINLVPLLPSPSAKWFTKDLDWLAPTVANWDFPRGMDTIDPATLPIEVLNGLFLLYTREILQNRLPPSDITIATSCLTAVPVHLYGSGRKFYFAQHFEPYFDSDTQNPLWWAFEARATYQLPLEIIANSGWLSRKLREEIGVESRICPNAIDQSVFRGSPKTGRLTKEVKIISYGGRGAQWKGFREMALGVRIARERLSDCVLRWQVFGNSALPPFNPIASYDPLGFLLSEDLASAYRQADILLSASWYESFPLFPLEAMSCGVPVITTQAGTEEFAIDKVTAEIVEPRNPEGIADSLVRLISDPEYRNSIAVRGHELARQFNWTAATDQMERILLGSNVRTDCTPSLQT